VNAAFTLSAAANTVNLTNTSAGATTYLWNFGDAATSSATSPAHTYTANGTYTITLIGYNSCNSDTTNMVVTITTAGINKLTLNKGINLYPNPSSGKITVETGYQHVSYEAIIYNSEGKQVYRAEVKHKTEINLKDQKPGIYFLQMKDVDNNIITQKFIIE